MDFVYCALVLGFAAALIGFVALCARVEKRP
jgi:membrane glycosyltransferase